MTSRTRRRANASGSGADRSSSHATDHGVTRVDTPLSTRQFDGPSGESRALEIDRRHGRGQAHTLEAFTAALLLVTGTIFALQATAVTPLSASTSNQHIENQLQMMGDDLLVTADANGTLQEAVVYWNASENRFVNASDDGYYKNEAPPNAFGNALGETFGRDHLAFNVIVSYWDNSTETYEHQRMVYSGAPSDNAVVATHAVVLYNDTKLVDPDDPDDPTVAEATMDNSLDFYAPDALQGSTLHNVLEVRIVVWRM